MEALNVIKNGLSHDSVPVRLNTISHIAMVAKVLEAEVVQTHLFPIIDGHVFGGKAEEFDLGTERLGGFKKDVSDEDVAALAGNLDGEFMMNAGGLEFCEKQLEFLARTCCAEETVIRTNATKSLISCINLMAPEESHQFILPIFHRLQEDVTFPNRVSAAQISPVLYKNIEDPEIRVEILEIYKKLIRDPMPMVRTEAFKQLSEFIKLSDSKFYNTHCCLFLHHLINEPSSPGEAKLLLVQIALTILEEFPQKENRADIIFQRTWCWLEQAGKSPAWRTRSEFLKHLPRICAGYDAINLRNVCTENIYPIILDLLADSETKVRELALEKFVEVIDYLDVEEPNTLLQTIAALAIDDALEVKEKCASKVIEIFTRCNLDTKKLIEILNEFKNDSKADQQNPNSSVLMNLCENFGTLVNNADNEYLPAIHDFVNDIYWEQDQKWRIQHAIVMNVAQISERYTQQEFDSSPFKGIFFGAFTEKAYQVREEACKQLPQLCVSFDPSYVFETLFSPITELFTKSKSKYQHRVVAFHALRAFAENDLKLEIFDNYFASMLDAGLEDPVSNVKIIVCRACYSASDVINESAARETVIQKLDNLKDDPDQDCRYYAYEALQKLNQI